MSDVCYTLSPSPVLRLSHHPSHACVYVQTRGGEVYRYLPSGDTPTPNPSLSPYFTFPSPCPHFAVVDLAGSPTSIGRDARSRLYADTTLLTPLCSSLSLAHPSFLTFTISGSQHALFFISLHHPLSHALSPATRSDPHSFRFIERGAHLLTLIPSTLTPRAVLQMPRGNLEAIYPRTLTLHSLNAALHTGRWREAYVTARQNRVDLNLLYDHHPQRWYDDVEAFVQQVRDVDWLNLFMSAVQDRDVRAEDFPNYQPLTHTTPHPSDPSDPSSVRARNNSGGSDGEADADMDRVRAGLTAQDEERVVKRGQRMHLDRKAREAAAAEMEQRLMSAPPASTFAALQANTSKVNLICDRLREVFLRLDPDTYTLCILTSYVRKTPPQLEDALSVIKQMRDSPVPSRGPAAQQVEGGREDKSRGVWGGAEGALKYVIFLCDVQALYDVAMGMYDEGLTLMVAQQARMDPAEYLPLVHSLMREKRGPWYRQHRIDAHLKRWPKAATALIRAIDAGEVRGEDEWPELLRLVRAHALWDVALRLVTPPSLNDASPAQPRTRVREERAQWGPPAYDLITPAGRFRSLQQAYGEYLRGQKQPTQAAAAFLLAHDYDQALVAYREAGEWMLGLPLAHSLSFSHSAVCDLAHAFISFLRTQSQRVRDAAFLTVEYFEDVEEAVALLLAAEDWEEAVRTCWMKGRGDLMHEVVEADMRQGLQRMERMLDRRLDKYREAVHRLRVVRRAKLLLSAEKAERAEEGPADAAADDDDDDLLSIVSGVSDSVASSSSASSVSGISALTGVSSASAGSSVFSLPSQGGGVSMTADERRMAKAAERLKRRAHKRRVKEGSRGEEAALVELIREVRLSPQVRQRLMRAVQTWVMVGWRDEAALVQRKWKALEQAMEKEEGRDMPMMQGMNEEQQGKLRAHWDWPANVQRSGSEGKEELGSLRVLDYASTAEEVGGGEKEGTSRSRRDGKRAMQKADRGVQEEEDEESVLWTE